MININMINFSKEVIHGKHRFLGKKLKGNKERTTYEKELFIARKSYKSIS